jgi:formate hydrogenlyase subunit 3/multisubunit Na+/H+ antiporter MnhD subunit
LILTGLLVTLVAGSSSWLAIDSLFSGSQGIKIVLRLFDGTTPLTLVCDSLSAFFILAINFTVMTGYIYSSGYLSTYRVKMPVAWIRFHYLALLWLQASMVLVTLFRDGFYFLMAWELMTLSSFLLVIFDIVEKKTVRTGLSYLVQMHAGMLFILAAMILSSAGKEGISFDNLPDYFLSHSNWPVFLLFFIGFGLKAGFFFLHTWLPDAHPAAPSHVSGIMSGVMIKIGIFGILRVASCLSGDMGGIGTFLILISSITGLFGVMMAILQHDVKKLLAYHSIENIGIIGIGIGLGIAGKAIGNDFVSAAGYAGALMHTLNHSLFKSLLFYGSGSVITRLHTRDLNKMGGLMKYMPFTAWAFLTGAIAISGIPLLNGFISEFLIYSSLFNGMGHPSFYPLLVFFIALLSLVLIGGLALMCFTKVFGVIFLGHPRSVYTEEPTEVSKSMLIAKYLPVLLIIMIGVFPFVFVKPVIQITGHVFGINTTLPVKMLSRPMLFISVASVSLILLAAFLLLARKLVLRNKIVREAPTWGCGYTANFARQQYTSTSFVQEYARLIKPLIKTGHSNISFNEKEMFPEEREFHTRSDDFVRSRIINRAAGYIVNLLRRAAVFHTGNLQHYVLYVLLFLVMIFLISYLKLI